MPPRLRKQESWRKEPQPTLKYTCRMCEAEFPNRTSLMDHIDLNHGQCRFYSTWLYGCYSLGPYIVSPTEKRSCLEHFATAQQTSTRNPENEPYTKMLDRAVQRKQLLLHVYLRCDKHADENKLVEFAEWAEPQARSNFDAKVCHEPSEQRSFIACVFCAMLHWSEDLARPHLPGPDCTMENRTMKILPK